MKPPGGKVACNAALLVSLLLLSIISAIASVLVDVAAHNVPVASAVAVDSAVVDVISAFGVA